jgi:hypothetical protein
MQAGGCRMMNTGLSRFYEAGERYCLLSGLEIVRGKGCSKQCFWVCPCGRHCAAVYRAPGSRHYECRRCAGYRYWTATRQGDRWGQHERLEQEKERLEKAVRGGRPKGMHKKTYGRLRHRLIEAEMALDEWDEALHLSIEGRPDRARQRIGRLE